MEKMRNIAIYNKKKIKNNLTKGKGILSYEKCIKARKEARKKINQKCVAGDRTYEAYKSGRTIPHTDGCGRG